MKKLALAFLFLMAVIVAVSALAALVWKDGGLSLGDKVALVYIEGPIMDSEAIVEELGDSWVSEHSFQVGRFKRGRLHPCKLHEVTDPVARRDLRQAEPVAGQAQSGCFGVNY